MALFDKLLRRQSPAQASNQLEPGAAAGSDVPEDIKPEAGLNFAPQDVLGANPPDGMPAVNPPDPMPEAADVPEDIMPDEGSTLVQISEMHSAEMTRFGAMDDDLVPDGTELADDLEMPEA